MARRHFACLVFLFVLTLFTSCSKQKDSIKPTKEHPSSKSRPENTQQQGDSGLLEQMQLPVWVSDPSVPGHISSVGMASQTSGRGIKMQIIQAETDAIVNMVYQIDTVVYGVVKESMRKASIADKTVDGETIDVYFAQAAKSLVKNIPLDGLKRKNIFQNPIDETLYIHMVLEQGPIKKYLIDSSKTFASGFKKFLVTDQSINVMEDSMRNLFSDLDFSKDFNKKVIIDDGSNEKLQ